MAQCGGLKVFIVVPPTDLLSGCEANGHLYGTITTGLMGCPPDTFKCVGLLLVT